MTPATVLNPSFRRVIPASRAMPPLHRLCPSSRRAASRAINPLHCRAILAPNPSPSLHLCRAMIFPIPARAL
ncbi:hypothetical protein E2562_038292 [Oryza meyeriana var. granulata]|uniref:Uncharacterized protein n=1 Tax=Oryza meyeriana var. granulata TaxID=110450 RepID=A0A6G1C439_9ORYZ|nr:hypothetical protein E2562_038292 [Oryza meyeriana var. granulata]